MKRFVLFGLLLILSSSISAQSYHRAAQVSNVDAYQEEKNIIITFDTEKDASLFYIYYSTNGKNGKFNLISSSLTKEKISATKYKYTWKVLESFDKFIYDNVVFKVEAYKYQAQQSYSTSSATKSYSNNTTKSTSSKQTKKWESHSIYMSLGGFYSLNNDWGVNTKIGFKGIYMGLKFDLDYTLKGTGMIKTDIIRTGIEKERLGCVFGYNWFWQKQLSIYTGIGFGIRNYYWGNNEYMMNIVEENSIKGVDVECGLNYMFTPHIGITAGYSTLQFAYSEFSTGLIVKF